MELEQTKVKAVHNVPCVHILGDLDQDKVQANLIEIAQTPL